MNRVQMTWKSLKKKHPKAIVLMRLGDFYEAFNEDARIVAEVCDVVYASRKFWDARWPMAGFAAFAVDGYVRDLVDAGYTVALAEEVGQTTLCEPKQPALL